jgi:hypothetical protein
LLAGRRIRRDAQTVGLAHELAARADVHAVVGAGEAGVAVAIPNGVERDDAGLLGNRGGERIV